MYTILWRRIYGFYWLTSVEINKHKIFDANNAWITELQFQKPKKHNLSNLPHQIVEKLQKNHGVLRGPQLDKQRWRARLGILRVKVTTVIYDINTVTGLNTFSVPTRLKLTANVRHCRYITKFCGYIFQSIKHASAKSFWYTRRGD